MVDPYPTGPDSIRTSPAEHLLGLCLMAPPKERPEVLTTLCQENPSEAKELRQLYSLVENMALSEPIDSPQPRATPDRLGDFRLIRRIGGGGMGVVYLAQQEGLARKVALKIIRPELLYFPRTKKRFLREGKALAALKHPNIVPIYATGEVDGIPFIAMEWVEGKTLAETLEELSDRPRAELEGTDLLPGESSYERACLRIARQVADALAYTHSRGIVHRDVKPSNLIVTATGRVQLLDFGLAHSPESDHLTTCSNDEGSLAYMPPERLRGEDRQADARSDVYSLGVTLYEMLALHLPFRGKSRGDTRALILRGKIRHLNSWGAQVSWEAETVCLTAMSAEVRDRYPDAETFITDVDNALHLRPLVARRPGVAHRLHRWGQRNRLAAAFLLFFLISTIVTLGFALHAESARKDADSERRTAKATSLVLKEILTQAARQMSDPTAKGQSLTEAIIWTLDQVEERYEDHPEAEAKVRLTVGSTLASLGALNHAYQQVEKSCEIYGRLHGETSAEVLECLHRMCWIASLQDKKKLGYELSKTCVELSAQIHGPWDPKTFARRNYHTKRLLAVKRRHEALAHAKAVRRESQLHLGEGKLQRILAARELAYVLLDLRRPRKALALTTEALEVLERTRGRNHTETLRARRPHAYALARLGKHRDAERHLREIFDRRIALEGVNGIKTVHARNTLAMYLTKRRRYDEARRLLMQSLEVAQSRSLPLGDHEPQLVRSTRLLADLERKAKRLDEALEWSRRAITYGTAENQYKTDSYVCLIQVLLDRGEVEEALSATREHLHSLEQAWGRQSKVCIDFRLRTVRRMKSAGHTRAALTVCRECREVLGQSTAEAPEDLRAHHRQAERLEKSLAEALEDD